MYRLGMSKTRLKNQHREKTYNVFVIVRVTTKSESKTKAIEDASNMLDTGTVIGAEISVLDKDKWKHLEPVWYD